jgi:hypothetical protein
MIFQMFAKTVARQVTPKNGESSRRLSLEQLVLMRL